jgi:hypothetical protein
MKLRRVERQYQIRTEDPLLTGVFDQCGAEATGAEAAGGGVPAPGLDAPILPASVLDTVNNMTVPGVHRAWLQCLLGGFRASDQFAFQISSKAASLKKFLGCALEVASGSLGTTLCACV